MRILGIDPSLTGTGVVLLEATDPTKNPKILFSDTSAVGEKNLTSGHPKTLKSIAWFADTCGIGPEGLKADVAVIEGYAFGSHRVASLVEVGTVFRLNLMDAGIPFVSVFPTTLKKFAFGVGRGKKSLILKVALKRWGFDTEDDNQADAYALARLGLAAFNDQNCEPLTKAMRETVTLVREQVTHLNEGENP